MSKETNIGRSAMKFVLVSILLLLVLGIGKAAEQKKKLKDQKSN